VLTVTALLLRLKLNCERSQKLLPPFWRTLLALLILPPYITSVLLYHAQMMVFLYRYTPFTEQNVNLVEFRDTD
jgi:hypothetical protein